MVTMGPGGLIRTAVAMCCTGAVLAVATPPARADAAEDQFVADIKRSNAVHPPVPATPDIWIKAGRASCDRISAAVGQGQRLQSAINNEVIATGAYNSLSRQNAVTIVTFAVLDLCPYLIPANSDGPVPDGGDDSSPDTTG